MRRWVVRACVIAALLAALFVLGRQFWVSEGQGDGSGDEHVDPADRRPELTGSHTGAEPKGVAVANAARPQSVWILRGRVELLGPHLSDAPPIHLRLHHGNGVVRGRAAASEEFELRVPRDGWEGVAALRVHAEGYSFVDVRVGPADHALGTIQLLPVASYRGRLIGPGGEPVAGVRVSLGRHASFSATAVERTDALGRFTIPLASASKSFASDLAFGVSPSTAWELYLSKGGHAWPPARAQVAGLVDEHVVRLPRIEDRLAVLIVDEAGQPAAGVVVWSLSALSPPADIESAMTRKEALARTGEDGFYYPEFYPRAEVLCLRVQRDPSGPVRHYVIPRALLRTDAPYRLSLAAPQRRLTLEVLDARGHVLRQAYVRLRLPIRQVTTRQTVDLIGRTDMDGLVSWVLADSERAPLGMARTATMGRVEYRDTKGASSVGEGTVHIELGLRDSRSVLRLDPESLSGEVPLWLRVPRDQVSGAGPPAEVGFSWLGTKGERVGRMGRVVGERPAGLGGVSDPVWRILDMKPSEGVASLPEALAWIRFSNGTTRRYTFAPSEWATAYKQQSVLELHSGQHDAAALVVRLERPAGAASDAGSLVACVVRATCLEMPDRFAEASSATTTGHLDKEASLARLLAPARWVITARSVDGRWHGMHELELRSGSHRLSLVMAEGERFEATVELPDGSIPDKAICLLRPKLRAVASPVRCDYDPRTGRVTSPRVLVSAFEVSVMAVVPDGRRHVRHVAVAPAAMVHGGKLVLTPQEDSFGGSVPSKRNR